jgi:hypothetical protein
MNEKAMVVRADSASARDGAFFLIRPRTGRSTPKRHIPED